jgi:hypothetical protein
MRRRESWRVRVGEDMMTVVAFEPDFGIKRCSASFASPISV